MRHLFLTAGITLVALPLHARPQVTPLVPAERGSMVTVQGTVARILDAEAPRTGDACGNIRVYVGPRVTLATLGEAVTVHGFVVDALGARQIYARSITRADGTEVSFDHRD